MGWSWGKIRGTKINEKPTVVQKGTSDGGVTQEAVSTASTVAVCGMRKMEKSRNLPLSFLLPGFWPRTLVNAGVTNPNREKMWRSRLFGQR